MTSCYRNNQLKMNKERETTRNFLKETECTAEPSRILQGRRRRDFKCELHFGFRRASKGTFSCFLSMNWFLFAN